MNRNAFILILSIGLIPPALANADQSFDADAYIMARANENNIAIDADSSNSSTTTQTEDSTTSASTDNAQPDSSAASATAPAVIVNPAPAATEPTASNTPTVSATPTASTTPTASAAPAASAAATPATPTLFGDIFKKYNISPTGSVTLDGYSQYVWRGQYLDRKPVFEPGVSISSNGLTLGYWSNWDANAHDPVNSGESDYYMSYAYTLGNWTATAGHTWYNFPGVGSNSKEFSFGIGYNTFLSPTFTFYHDYKAGQETGGGNGNYYDLTLSQTYNLYKPYGITYTLGSTFGLVDHQWIDGIGEHFTPTLMVNVPINANMTVCPTIGYNITAGALHDKDIGNFGDSFFGGVHTNINF